MIKPRLNIFTNAFILVLVLSSSGVRAQAELDVQDGDSSFKIGVLDMASALFNSEIARVVDEQVQTETAEDQERVRSLAAEAQTLQERLETDAEVMAEAEQNSIIADIQEIGVQYEFLVQRIEGLVTQRRQEFEQTYSPNLVQAISEVFEEGGYDMVIRAEAVLFFANTLDITAQVTEKLNQQQ